MSVPVGKTDDISQVFFIINKRIKVLFCPDVFCLKMLIQHCWISLMMKLKWWIHASFFYHSKYLPLSDATEPTNNQTRIDTQIFYTAADCSIIYVNYVNVISTNLLCSNILLSCGYNYIFLHDLHCVHNTTMCYIISSVTSNELFALSCVQINAMFSLGKARRNLNLSFNWTTCNQQLCKPKHVSHIWSLSL